jgi:hypothetical protein
MVESWRLQTNFLLKKYLDEKWKIIIFESLEFSNFQIIAPTYEH